MEFTQAGKLMNITFKMINGTQLVQLVHLVQSIRTHAAQSKDIYVINNAANQLKIVP